MIELNNFYIGESTTFMRNNIPDDFVDLTVTSPPYDNLRTYKGFIFDYQSMLKELYRVTKSGGVVVWIVSDATIKGSETGTSFKHALYAKEIGFNLHDTMIWHKPNPMPNSTQKRYTNCFEYMFVFCKDNINTFNCLTDECKYAGVTITGTQTKSNGERIQKTGYGKPCKDTKPKYNIWSYTVGGGYIRKELGGKHPAPFPEQLVEDHILSWTNENDIVFDPMCGAGTTCKMAWLNKRNFIGIDMSEEYINDICIPRLNSYGWQQNQKITF